MKRYVLLLALAMMGVPSWAASGQLTTSSSTCTSSANCLTVMLPEDKGGAGLQVAGTWTGTITFEVTVDGQNWAAISVTPSNSSTTVTTTTANGVWQVNLSGAVGIRMRASATMTGTALVTITPSYASAQLFIGGGSGSGVSSLTCTAPLLCSGSTGAVTLSAPSLTALSSVPQCSAVTTTQLFGQCAVTYTAAQINGSSSGAPLTAIPALGSTIVVDPLDAVCEKEAGTAFVVGSTNFNFGYGGTSFDSFATVGFLDQTAVTEAFIPGASAGSVIGGEANTAVTFFISGGTTTDGSPVYCTLSYRIHTNQ
jgi:hypothetical protein